VATLTSTVRVYDMETGNLLRVTTARGELASRLAKADEALANGEMTKRAHNALVRVLARMERAIGNRDEWKNADDASLVERAIVPNNAHRDYDGVWTDEMRSAFFAF
jgi:hypothetical protein